MRKLVKKLNRPVKKRWLFVAIIIVLVLLIGWWAYDQHRERPLSNSFEYLGKSDYGCWVVCDSNPGSTYYYATDMSVKEVTNYFKRTTSSSLRTFDGITDFTLKTKSGNTISIYYYIDKNRVRSEGFNKETNKKAIVSIPSFHYDTAKDAL